MTQHAYLVPAYYRGIGKFSRLCNLLSGVLCHCDMFSQCFVSGALVSRCLHLYSYESYGRFLPYKLKVMGFGFKIHAIDGEKWVEIFAM